MPRVVPSNVLAIVDKYFPPEQYGGNNPRELTYIDLTTVTAILELVKQIPVELIVVSSERYADYLASVAILTSRARVWESMGNTLPIRIMPGLEPPISPVTVMRAILADCPDKIPSPRTAELKFIRDKELRTSLMLDISSVNSDLSNQEWKSATVLAGSTVEALLLWAIRKATAAARAAAVTSAVANGSLTQRPDNNVLKWDLHEYIEVAVELSIVTADTAQQTRLGKDYRNLIHPGKEQRKRMKCDRATALSAVAALEHVVRDLKSLPPSVRAH
jgi:hypothetical protein